MPAGSVHTASFTVDVEDGISIAMRDAFGVDLNPTDRVVKHTEKILEIFSDQKAKGTFFTLGIIAEHYPDLVKKIGNEGHELAVHGYNHLLFTKMTKERAYQELDRAKKLIEDISGKKVYGHRAPAFSVNENTSWAFDVIADCGFLYDSSVMPCKGPRYGWPGFANEIVKIDISGGKSLIEVPMSTATVLGRKVPACGGSYLRLLPYALTKKFFSSIQDRTHPIVYIHPYELDTARYPDFFFEKLKKTTLRTNLSLRSNWIKRKTVEQKFRKLMDISGSKSLIDIIFEKEDNNDIAFYKIK